MTRIYKGLLIRKKNCTILISFILLIIIVLALFGKPAHASKTYIPCDKYYKTYTVCENDTLSSLALRFAGISDRSLDDYIDEVRYINAIHNYTIYEGQTLVIPYYLPSEQ